MLTSWLTLFIPVLSLTRAQLQVEERVPCLPDGDLGEEVCTQRGCVWNPVEAPAPSCYIPQEYGYRAVGEMYDIAGGKAVDLERATGSTLFGSDFDKIRIEFQFQTENRLRVKIFPVDVERFEVPIQIKGAEEPPLETEYSVEASYEPVFSFRVVRQSSGTVVFDSSLGGLTLADQFLQIATRLPSNHLYGFAEQEQPSLKHDLNWKTWGMFARDQAPEGDANLYGVHPRYTVLEEDGNAHGVLILNSNAQDVTLTPAPGLVYRTIGGILDLYLFLGPTPEAVVQQYTEAVGRYYVPPYWALGFHLCRWGYNSLENMKAAWQRTIDAGIPFDAQWGDIDIMDRALDFTVNPNEFAGLAEFVDQLHEEGMKFVTILDPCISTGEAAGTYPPFDEGNKQAIWILNSTGQPLVGKVWPADNIYYPDYFKPETQDWWVQQIVTFHDQLAWDGLWIDMNEPSNFVTGSVTGCQTNKWNNPPYKPKSNGDTLAEKTICLDAEQHMGKHYDLHSMYGWSETEPTLRGVQEATGKRGLVLSRSTFISSGKWTAHWLGDNWSEWDNMHYSIIGMLQFNQFGIPLVGADICGFIGNATEELCARWQQLGAFYPFSRNHNLLESGDQDPGVWEGGLVARVAKESLEIKYFLLPFLYSLFYQHALQGGTVVRPVWHEFPRDPTARDIDTQFMWGPALMVSPVIEQGVIERKVYLPDGSLWYDFHRLTPVDSGIITVRSDLHLEEDSVPLHLRGGHVIPAQVPGRNTVQSLAEGRYFLIAALDRQGTAQGELYLDDGESVNLKNVHTKLSYQVAPGVMVGLVETRDYEQEGAVLEEIWILGEPGPVTQVVVNNDLEVQFVYDTQTLALKIYLTNLPLIQPFTVHWF